MKFIRKQDEKYSRTIWLLPISLLMISVKGFDQNFEGIIEYEIPELKKEIGASRLDYMISGHMMRIEYKSGDSESTAILYDSQNETMYIKISRLNRSLMQRRYS